ncbi:MAG TPA: hypothetical protein VGE98_14425, partial [Thermoanaerobaculia bacterium]
APSETLSAEPPSREPQFSVSGTAGDVAVVPETTAEVAGRQFVFDDGISAWVQRGVSERDSAIVVAAGSPQGKALLARFSNLGVLLHGGSRVVMRDNLKTLELWSGS